MWFIPSQKIIASMIVIAPNIASAYAAASTIIIEVVIVIISHLPASIIVVSIVRLLCINDIVHSSDGFL